MKIFIIHFWFLKTSFEHTKFQNKIYLGNWGQSGRWRSWRSWRRTFHYFCDQVFVSWRRFFWCFCSPTRGMRPEYCFCQTYQTLYTYATRTLHQQNTITNNIIHNYLLSSTQIQRMYSSQLFSVVLLHVP